MINFKSMCDICRYFEIANFMFQCIYNDLQPVDKYHLILSPTMYLRIFVKQNTAAANKNWT